MPDATLPSPMSPDTALGTGYAASLAAGLWVDRGAEATRVLRFIAEAGRLVVLYGKRGIGKTALLRRWVMPQLGDGAGFYLDLGTTLHGEAAAPDRFDRLWAAMQGGATVFVDSAEELLDAEPGERERFLSRTRALAKLPDCRCHLVLVINEERLRDLFVLRSQIPDILDHTLEIAGIDLRRGLAALPGGGGPGAAASPRDGAARSGPGLPLATADLSSLATKSGGVSPELLRIIVARLRRSPAAATAPAAAGAAGAASGSHPAGEAAPPKLASLLWDYVRERLEALAGGPDGAAAGFDLGLAILEQVAASAKSAAPLPLPEIALRIGVALDGCRQTLASLQGEEPLIREIEEGRYVLVPAELAEVVIAECRRRQEFARESEHLIDQAMAVWRASDTLLPRRDFREVHRHRRNLRLHHEEIELLLRSSLLHDDGPGLPAARYWLQRLADPSAAADILSSSLLHRLDEVRARAATLLGDRPEPAVRDQLHQLALRDPQPAVRQCAVASLARMKTAELRAQLVGEVHAARSPYRAAALEALSIFDDDATVEVVRSLLATGDLDPALRQATVGLLSRLGIAEAADLLLALALTAPVRADREAAGKGLAAIASEPLQAHVLGALRANRSAVAPAAARPHGGAGLMRAARPAARLLLALAIVLVNFNVHGFVLLLRKRYRFGLLILAAEGVGVACFAAGATVTGLLILMLSLSCGQLGALRVVADERRTGPAAAAADNDRLAALLCLSCVLSPACWYLHGLVHAAVRRLRTGALLLGLEASSIFLIASTTTLHQMPWTGVASLPDRLLAVTARGYWWLGVLLFAGTFFYDVCGVLLGEIVLAEAFESRRRRHAVYRLLLQNPVAARCVIEDLGAADPTAARWARWILRRFGPAIPQEVLLAEVGNPPRLPAAPIARSLAASKTEATVRELTAAWAAADSEARQTIVTLLATTPTEASIQALAERRQQLSWPQRCRSVLAAWRFRFGVWPKLSLAGTVLALLLVGLLGIEGYRALRNPASTQLRVVEGDGDETVRLRTADFLASVYPQLSEQRLADLFGNPLVPQRVRKGLAKSLSLVILRGGLQESEAARTALIGASEPGEEPWLRHAALTSVASTLRDRSDPRTADALRPVLSAILINAREDLPLRRLALAGLAAMESAPATAALQDFALAGWPPPLPGRDAGETQRREEDLRLEAIAALRRMGSPEAAAALGQLAAAPIPASLQAAARQAGADPLRRIRDDLDQGKPDHAVMLAKRFLAAPAAGAGPGPTAEVYALLGRARYQIASSAVADNADWRSAANDLHRAQAAGSPDPEVPRLLALVQDQLSTR
jgi:hypothetical protein